MPKNRPSATALTFHEITFHPITRKGQPWLTAAEIAAALGYASDDAISRIYRRRAGEFTAAMSETVKLTVSGNLQKEARIFSLRGAHLLGMFARTERAAEFRRWVLDILDAQNEAEAQRRAKPGANAMTVQPAPQARAGISRELRQAINRKAHEIAVKQYDTIHDIITAGVEDNIACGATEEAAFGYVETYGNLADGTVVFNVRDLYEIVWNSQQVINTAACAIAAIRRIERRTGIKLALRLEKSKHVDPDFHKHDRLVDEVIDRMSGRSVE